MDIAEILRLWESRETEENCSSKARRAAETVIQRFCHDVIPDGTVTALSEAHVYQWLAHVMQEPQWRRGRINRALPPSVWPVPFAGLVATCRSRSVRNTETAHPS